MPRYSVTALYIFFFFSLLANPATSKHKAPGIQLPNITSPLDPGASRASFREENPRVSCVQTYLVLYKGECQRISALKYLTLISS